MIEWTMSGEAATWADVPKGATVTCVMGREVLGMCESCGRPVLMKSQNVVLYADDIVTHKRCPKRTPPRDAAKEGSRE